MLIAHPKTISIFPQFAKENIATLMSNPEFLATGKMVMTGFEFIVNNLQEPQVIRRLLANRPFENYFVSYVSIPQQLEVRFFTQCHSPTFANWFLMLLMTGYHPLRHRISG